MLRVTATAAKNSLGSLLSKVKAGETVLITSRGKPIAALSPVDERMQFEDGVEYAALVANGTFDPPRKKLNVKEFLAKEAPSLPSGMTAVDLINWEREGL